MFLVGFFDCLWILVVLFPSATLFVNSGDNSVAILGVLLALSPTRDRCLPWCRHLVVDGSAVESYV